MVFRCPVLRTLKPIAAVDEGQIKRIRGIAYATRVSPQTANRMVDAARALLNKFIPDVFIYTDHYKGNESGKYAGATRRNARRAAALPPAHADPAVRASRLRRSPGFGLSLVAESTTGVLIHTELYAKAGDTPEDIGRRAAKQLYLEISRVRPRGRRSARAPAPLTIGRRCGVVLVHARAAARTRCTRASTCS